MRLNAAIFTACQPDFTRFAFEPSGAVCATYHALDVRLTVRAVGIGHLPAAVRECSR